MAEKTEKPEKQQKPGQEKGAKAPKADKKKKGEAAAAPAPEQAAPEAPEERIPPRLRLLYQSEIAPALMRELKIENRLRVPQLSKIVINMALGEARDNVKILDAAVEELKQIVGQKPVITKARKAISNFKLREGMPIGAMVTLRRERMWEFFDRLVNIALPRVRDFRGVSEKSFDGRGNYSLGISDQTIFPEIDLDKIKRQQGMDITIVTSAGSDEEARELLKMMGMPFAEGR